MSLEESFDAAIFGLRSGVGLVTVALGQGVDAPSSFSSHPRVYWLTTTQLRPDAMTDAVPSNTRLMIVTPDIPSGVFQQLQLISRRRQVPYLSRKADALAQELTRILPHKTHTFTNAPAFVETANDDAVEAPADVPALTPAEEEEMAQRKKDAHAQAQARGTVRAFVLRHADLKKGNSEEARRLLPIAQRENITATIGALSQCIADVKRKGGLNARPESLQAAHITGQVALVTAIDDAIESLTRLKNRAMAIDAVQTKLQKDNDDLRARLVLAAEAFKGLGGES